MNFLKINNIAFSKLKDNWFLQLAIFVQIALAVFTLNCVMARISHLQRLEKFAKQTGLLENSLYVNVRLDIDSSVAFSDSQNILKNFDCIEKYMRSSAYKIGTGASIIADKYIDYDENFADTFHMPMYKGKWLNNVNLQNDVKPAIISYNLKDKYKIGDIFEILGNTYQICGIAAPNSYAYIFSGGGTMLSLDDTLLQKGSFVIMKNSSPKSWNCNFAIKIKEGYDLEKSALECRNALRNIASVYSFQELLNKSMVQNNEVISMQSFTLAILIFLCLINVGAANLLYSLSDRKIFSLYFMHGLNWKQSFIITCYRNLFSLILPAITGFGAYIVFLHVMHATTLKHSNMNILYSLLLLLAIFILTSVLPLMKLRKTSPIEYIRRM
jgi:hypothetical protein